jgi:hypothetical protein
VGLGPDSRDIQAVLRYVQCVLLLIRQVVRWGWENREVVPSESKSFSLDRCRSLELPFAEIRREENASMSAKKFVIVGCVVLALACLFSEIGLDAYYRTNRPFEPEPAVERVYITKLSKGVLVYLTHREQVIYQSLMPSGAGLLMIAFLLNLYWKQFPIFRRPRA